MSLLLSLVEPLNYPALLEDAGVVSAWRTALLHLHSTHGFATPDRPPGVIMLLAHPDHELRTVVSCPSSEGCRSSNADSAKLRGWLCLGDISAAPRSYAWEIHA